MQYIKTSLIWWSMFTHTGILLWSVGQKNAFNIQPTVAATGICYQQLKYFYMKFRVREVLSTVWFDLGHASVFVCWGYFSLMLLQSINKWTLPNSVGQFPRHRLLPHYICHYLSHQTPICTFKTFLTATISLIWWEELKCVSTYHWQNWLQIHLFWYL